MRIKSMTATFGRLQNARLELGEGLNILEGPNEGGKSTWCAFLRAMLYGIPTRERDTKTAIAEKNRYQPWSGGAMEGAVELEWQGRDITLRRGPKGSTPFGAFSAVYTGTGEPVPGLTGENCGEKLLGVPRAVFERTAFVGQSGAAIAADSELEKRVAALVSSGEEEVSYSQVEGRLKEWLRRRKYNKSGLIPKLGALVSIMPQAVLGGAAVMMFSSIVVSGIQLITKEKMTPRTLTIVSVALGVGYGMGANASILAKTPQLFQLVCGESGIVPAAFVAIVLNVLLPKDAE